MAHRSIAPRDAVPPTDPFYRIARSPDVTQYPPWRVCGKGRFDDPKREFRVLYAAEDRLGCFVETLEQFSSPLALLEELRDTPSVFLADDILRQGVVPKRWHLERWIGRFQPCTGQKWLDLRATRTHRFLRVSLARTLANLGAANLDFSDILSRRRDITQAIARWAYEHGYQGIAYKSRIDSSLDCWAVFEGAEVMPAGHAEEILRDDEDLLRAVDLLLLTLDSKHLVEFRGSTWRIHRKQHGALDATGLMQISGRYHLGTDKFSEEEVWPALYTALTPEGAIVQIASLDRPGNEHYLGNLKLTEIAVDLSAVLDLRDVVGLGLKPFALVTPNYRVPRLLASTANFWQCEGILVPSLLTSLASGDSLIIFLNRLGPQSRVEAVSDCSPSLVELLQRKSGDYT